MPGRGIGVVIRAHRLRHNWSQRGLARVVTNTGIAKMTASQVNMVELGEIKKVGSDKLEALADVFGTTVDELLREANTSESPALTLSRRVRTLRKQRRLSLAELGAASGVAPDYINALEGALRVNPSREVIVSLANALDVLPEDLVDSSWEQLPPTDRLTPPVDLAPAPDPGDQELAEVVALWPYLTRLERELLLTTLRERARRPPHQQSRQSAEEPRDAPANGEGETGAERGRQASA